MTYPDASGGLSHLTFYNTYNTHMCARIMNSLRKNLKLVNHIKLDNGIMQTILIEKINENIEN